MIEKYNDSYKNILKNMLKSEGITEDKMAFDMFDTYVYCEDNIIKGFYTIREWHKLPALQHLYVDKKYRTFKLARLLINSIKEKVREKNNLMVIVLPIQKLYLYIIASYFFRNMKRYFTDIEEGNKYYLVEV